MYGKMVCFAKDFAHAKCNEISIFQVKISFFDKAMNSTNFSSYCMNKIKNLHGMSLMNSFI